MLTYCLLHTVLLLQGLVQHRTTLPTGNDRLSIISEQRGNVPDIDHWALFARTVVFAQFEQSCTSMDYRQGKEHSPGKAPAEVVMMVLKVRSSEGIDLLQ